MPEEDAVEGSGDNYLRIGDKQILWGVSTSSAVTFSKSFSETPTVTIGTVGCSAANNQQIGSLSMSGFTASGCNPTSFHWQAIGKYK